MVILTLSILLLCGLYRILKPLYIKRFRCPRRKPDYRHMHLEFWFKEMVCFNYGWASVTRIYENAVDNFSLWHDVETSNGLKFIDEIQVAYATYKKEEHKRQKALLDEAFEQYVIGE